MTRKWKEEEEKEAKRGGGEEGEGRNEDIEAF